MLSLLVLAQDADVHVFGVRLIGFSAATGRKLLLTVVLVVLVLLVSAGVRWLAGPILRGSGHERGRFWARQVTQILAAVVLVVGLISIWFEDPTRFAGALGLVTAGVAVALQRVITSLAAYLIILRGRVFTVGDRITIGGVRGDVVRLGFMQTAVMEMGEPPAVQDAPPSTWVTARQYTGRIVHVTNDKIFDSPVYNYTREFPYLWEEIRLPIHFDADRPRAEEILLDAARRHAHSFEQDARRALGELQRRFFLPEDVDLEPKVYLRITDNWVELTLRFVTSERGVRAVKDAMSREILAALQQANIGIASTTFEVVGVPRLDVRVTGDGGA
jgi:small-conductance mechanosensitive channel